MNVLDALKQVTTSIKSWVDENKVAKVDGKGLSTNDYTNSDKNKVSKIDKMANDLVVIDGKLYLAQDGVPLEESAVTLPSGGSGSSSSTTITLKNLLDSTTITAAVGGDAILKFNFESSEDNTGGICYIYVGDTLKGTASIISGDNEINVGSYVSEGANNVKITCSDIYSNSKSLSYVVNTVAIRITSTFSDAQVYNGDITIRYIPYGLIEKTIHFVVDDVDTTVTVTETGTQQTQVIPALYHGSHSFKLYATATINGTEIKSNELVYDIMSVEDGATTPIIGSAYNVSEIIQGNLVNIPFTLYDPSNMEGEVVLKIVSNGEVFSSTTRLVDRTQQYFATRIYPAGSVDFIIEYGVISKQHTINVVENSIDVSIKETDLKFELKSAGRSNSDTNRDVWADGDITTSFDYLNFDSTGWIQDAMGDTALRLSGEATATINFEPFKEDARQNGLTIELTFAIRDVNNREAIAVQCLSSGIGFTITGDTATLSSEQSQVFCKYDDETKISVSFVIEPRSQYRLMQVYLNGISSDSAQYSTTDNWQQVSPSKIIIGSPLCCIDLYSVRVYNTALTAKEIQKNYIASITDLDRQMSLYVDNDVYDLYGNLSFSELKKQIPVMVIRGDLPQSKGDKKKVQVFYTDNVNSEYNFEDNATLDIQGTSSQYFIRKNWKIKTSSSHQWAEGQLSDNIYCMKANYMDSSCCHNTGGANYAHFLYETKTPPQEDNELIRSTIYGHPCVIFHQVDSNADLEFIGRYNFNWDKGSDVYGFSSDYPLVQSVEFCNNTSDACLFHGPIPDDWGDDFEFRYPEDHTDISAFKIVHNFVVSTWQDGATNETLDETYIGVDGTTYNTDTAGYRLAKFVKEFEDYFDMDYTLLYYVFCMVLLLADNFAKNMFMTSWDGVKFAPWLYDLDTMLGVNNEGQNVLNPWLLDTDTINDADAVNGKASAFWQNFREGFSDKIKEYYQRKRSDGSISYDTIIKFFVEDQIQKFSMSVVNEDVDYKYVSMLRSDNDGSNLHLAKGSMEEYIKFFVESRLDFLDSYWEASDYIDDYISLRIYTPSGDLVVEPDATFNIIPFSDSFVGLKIKANGTLLKHRTSANSVATFEDGKTETYNDTETAIFPASEISSVGDLSAKYCGSVKVEKARRLTELIIGSGAEGYCNSNLHELSVGTNKLLKTIDIRNCPNYTATLDLSACPSIQNVYATGSSTTSVSLPSSGYLRVMHLPSTITNLTITNQQYLEDFQMEGYDNLLTMWVEQTTGVPVEDIMLNAPNLNRIRLIDVQWNAESEAALVQTIEKFKACLGLDANGNNTDKAVVTGRVTVAEKVSDEVIGDIYNNFPDLIVDDGSEEIYIVNYKDWDGSILYTLRLADGADAIDPISKGFISAPFRASDENYSYEFIGWSNIPTNVSRHYQVVAQYNTKVAINFAVDGEIIHSEYVIYGQNAEDPVANGTIDAPIKEGTDDIRYVFDRWDGSLLNITLPRTLNAVFANVYPVRYYATESSLTPHYVQWIKDGESAYDPVVAGECSATDDIITTNEKKLVFSNWADIPTEVTEICKVYAKYDTYWAARFLNDRKLYLLEWALDGSNVIQPKDYFENYTNPTRASTAQYDYTFSNWSGNFNSITEARDYEAVYTSTVRRYNVYFYNDTELLQTKENIQYGSGTSYTGATPTKLGVDNPEEYVFKGWLPAPTEITGETYCYALFKFTGYLFGKLSDDSEYGTVDNPNWDMINAYWDTINSDVEAYKAGSMSSDDLFAKYPIGGRMIIPVAFADGTVTADVEIIGHEHDNLSDDLGKAPLTFFCVDLPQIEYYMNETTTNEGGWEASAMRSFTNGELFEALPDKLKTIIKTVNKISDGGSNNKSLITTADNCWIASYDEVGLTSGSGNLSGQGELYSSIFSSNRDSRKKYITDDTAAGGWWLRTSYYSSNSTSIFWRITTSGGSYSEIAFNRFYVAFGFCI